MDPAAMYSRLMSPLKTTRIVSVHSGRRGSISVSGCPPGTRVVCCQRTPSKSSSVAAFQ
jgi:hypothetical protein